VNRPGLAGVVLAAGAGTRLRPLTDLRPKALCPVADRPLVDWALDRLALNTARIAVNIHHHRDKMLAHLSGRGLHLSVEEPAALGTAGALGNLRDWLAGDAVLVTNSDAWHPSRPDPLGPLVNGWDGERPRLLCVRSAGRGDFDGLRYVGAALLPWWSVRDLAPVPSGLYEVSWARLYAENALDLVSTPGNWVDCGTPADYLRANLAASGGASVVGAGAVVEGEVVRSVVWPGSRVAAGERLVEAIRADGLTVPARPDATVASTMGTSTMGTSTLGTATMGTSTIGPE
jgi:N-acetyl-alpha-D-muramate 1-phosphate uridylyltransferase